MFSLFEDSECFKMDHGCQKWIEENETIPTICSLIYFGRILGVLWRYFWAVPIFFWGGRGVSGYFVSMELTEFPHFDILPFLIPLTSHCTVCIWWLDLVGWAWEDIFCMSFFNLCALGQILLKLHETWLTYSKNPPESNGIWVQQWRIENFPKEGGPQTWILRKKRWWTSFLRIRC